MVLDKAKTLKSLCDAYSRIYIKKDVHPSIRNEWKLFASIQDKILANEDNNKYVIIGDCNARFGNIV